MRIMAVDYGEARTGVALSDPTGTLAGDAFVIAERGRNALVSKLAALCAERGVSRVVVGWPRHMNGGAGERAVLSEQLAARLEKRTGLPVTLWDERLTSVDAHRVLRENGRRGPKHRASVDAVAAALILEGYLANRRA